MYITQQHNQWPRTLPRIAARLRQVLDLPGLTVSTRRDHLAITWIGGPPADPVYAELRQRLRGVAPYRAVRLYPVAVFGATLLTGCPHPIDDGHFQTTWRMLHHRDLTADPFDEQLTTQGAVLAGMAGAPATAVVGWARRRWDWEMWKTLQRVGDPRIFKAVCGRADTRSRSAEDAPHDGLSGGATDSQSAAPPHPAPSPSTSSAGSRGRKCHGGA